MRIVGRIRSSIDTNDLHLPRGENVSRVGRDVMVNSWLNFRGPRFQVAMFSFQAQSNKSRLLASQPGLNPVNDLGTGEDRRTRAAWRALKIVDGAVRKTKNVRLEALLSDSTVLAALSCVSES